MHDLLNLLRTQTPVDVTEVTGRGSSVYVGLRYGTLSGGLVCAKTPPIRSIDLTLPGEDQPLKVQGTNTAEIAGIIWSLLETRSRPQARTTPVDLVA